MQISEMTASPSPIEQTAPPPATPRRQSLLMKRTEAAALCGLSVPTWDRLSAAGNNPAGFKVGGARVYLVEELEAWVRAGCPRRDVWKERWNAILSKRN